MVRSHLDFGASVYSPLNKGDIDLIESVQRRATKQLPEMKNLSYPDRLRKLKLPTLAYRRRRADMIEINKAVHGLYENSLVKFVRLRSDLANRQSTRFHDKTIYPTHSRTSIRQHSFGNRNVKVWNALPEYVVNAPSINCFKTRLDRCWAHQPLRYNYTEDILPRMPIPPPQSENASSLTPTPQED